MNLFGINGGELIVLVVLALLLLGPEKIPEYTRMLRDWVRKLRGMAETAKTQFKEETGTDFDDVDWAKYDPRQYDPRRIIREALAEPLEDLDASTRHHSTGSTAATATAAATAAPAVSRPSLPPAAGSAPADADAEDEAPVRDDALPEVTPFDSEAT